MTRKLLFLEPTSTKLQVCQKLKRKGESICSDHNHEGEPFFLDTWNNVVNAVTYPSAISLQYM